MAGFDDDRRHDPPPPARPTTRLRAWLRPASAAFAEVFSDAELEQERRLWELDRLIGAVDGETWVGTGGAYSFGLTVPGGEVGAAGITVIGVTPSHRRRGILRQMMRWLLDQARERDEPVAVLWATESAIYQRFGFGIGTLQSQFDIERTRVAFLRPAPAARPDPAGRSRRGRPPLPADLRRHPCPGAGHR